MNILDLLLLFVLGFTGIDAITIGNKAQAIQSSSSSLSHQQSILDPWRDYDILRKSKLEAHALEPFFASRPHLVAQRLWKVSSTLLRTRNDWMETKNGTRLCESVASLGPLAVKVGQTLSQRPDIVGKEAADELQRLQTDNVPFDNALAFAVLQESLQCQSIAPGIGPATSGDDKEPMFATMSSTPIACASLGQVYKATTHDGIEVAVKVQRPDAMAILAIDAQCFRLVFSGRSWLQKWQKKLSASSENDNTSMEEAIRGKQNVGTVIDRVARDILDELDYLLEARNNQEFCESLAFLGFVTTPTFRPEYSSERILVTEWIPGCHLQGLSVDQGLAMTRMAVEACTASLVLTGFVHADPHEGNLMLHEDGRVVFLDFGLMSRVDQNVMEGFAKGIQALLSEDWIALTEAFVDVGFVTTPILHRNSVDEMWRADPNHGIIELAAELENAMESTEGGKARFGALAEVLNKKISPRWLVFTPPFVLLLIRTFLTLEGIAEKLDPDFNIYQMAMPWAVRRSLSPSTQKGIEVFRSTLMTPDNRIQWARLLELTMGNSLPDDQEVKLVSDDSSINKKIRTEAAKKAAMNDAVGSLLGSTKGKALRRALRDLDTVDLLTKLSTEEGRSLVKRAATVAANKVVSRKPTIDDESAVDRRPVSPESSRLREKHNRWKKKVTRLLVMSHVKRQLGWRGVVNMARLSWRFCRFAVVATAQALRRQLIGKASSTSSVGTSSANLAI